LCEEYPFIKQSIEVVLRQIECNIPLNQLYLDLNSDEQIENDTKIPEEEIKELLEKLLIPFSNTAQWFEMLDCLENAEPFVHYPDLIKRLKNREI